MLSFRQKILLSYAIVFILILLLLFPFAEKSVTGIVKKTLEERTNQVIRNIESAPNLNTIIKRLDEQQSFVFFRVTLLSKKGKVLYDSHVDKLSSPAYKKHPEIEQALIQTTGYHEDFSHLFNQRFAYVAKRFEFHGKTYILRTAFPFKQIQELTDDFKIAILTVGVGILILFSCMTWMIINRLTWPIHQIIKAVKPYQEGKEDQVPYIELGKSKATEDFEKLAATLNSLSRRIQSQIEDLTKERNERAAILNSLIEGIIAVDPQMRVTFVNDTALKILSLDKKDLIALPFTEEHQRECFYLIQHCLNENDIATGQLEFRAKNDKITVFDLIAAPRESNDGVILVLQDKSSHYQLLEMGKAFIANASHELKTPITIVRGFAETLHDHPELSKKVVAEITHKIVLNCQRMDTLVKNLLTLADIENLPLSRLQPCDLVTLVHGCRHILLSIYENAKVSIENHTTQKYPLMADSDLLELAILNLLDNAVKYSKDTTVIDISLKEDDEHIIIHISDQGIGIPNEDLPYIFQRFYTVNKAHSRKLGGAGLGLSIVGTIIEKHSGTITVTSEQGKGSTFTIKILKKPHIPNH